MCLLLVMTIPLHLRALMAIIANNSKRVGRIQRQVRRAFIASQGRPLLMRDLAAMAAFKAAWDTLGNRQDHFHDCPHCGGKTNIPVHGGPAYKCTRCGKVTPEAELRRLSMRRAPADDD
jgi:DNA-directed RNA polymerase subunit RPC12/RpoP